MAQVRKDSRGRGMVVIDAEECKGCGLCVEVCPPSVLKISAALNRMGYHPAEYTGVECTGCGVCFYVCPEPAAITVYKRVDSKTAIAAEALSREVT
jgi:NAD-dependent dihydropyrimidine dehydrogenase PreA subunit